MIKASILALFSIIIFSFFLCGCFGKKSDEDRMKIQLEKLNRSIESNNDVLFLELIEDDTRQYFARILEASKHSNQAELQNFKSQTPLLDLLYIYSSRQIFTSRQLLDISTDDFIKLLLEYGGFNNILGTSFERSRNIDSGIAVTTTHQNINNQAILEGTLIFNNIADEWKIDLTSRHRKDNKFIEAFCMNKAIESDYKKCIKTYAKSAFGIDLEFKKSIKEDNMQVQE